MSSLMSSQRTDVFISFCRQDERWLKRLQTMLRPLVHRGHIVTWDSTRIAAGSDRFRHLEEAILRSCVAVLLVSSDYLADDSIATHELLPLLEAAAQEGVTILWVPIRHSMVNLTALSKLEPILDPEKPLQARTSAKREAALLEVCERILYAVEASRVGGPKRLERFRSAVVEHCQPGGSSADVHRQQQKNHFAETGDCGTVSAPELSGRPYSVVESALEFSAVLGCSPRQDNALTEGRPNSHTCKPAPRLEENLLEGSQDKARYPAEWNKNSAHQTTTDGRVESLALNAVRNSNNSGTTVARSPSFPFLLEQVLGDVLRDIGFQQVRSQKGGDRCGFDLVAYLVQTKGRGKQVWKFESRLLGDDSMLEDLIPRLIWNDAMLTFDRLVILCPSRLRDNLCLLLNDHPFPMTVNVLSELELEALVEHSPAALARLGLNRPHRSDNVWRIFEKTVHDPGSPISLDIVHSLDPPAEFDYLLLDDVVVKAYTEHEFRLRATLTNRSGELLQISSLEVKTVKYSRVKERVLRLVKPKGIYRPLEFTFAPSPQAGQTRDVLGGNIWEIGSGNQETIELLLADKGLVPGLYEVFFRAAGRLGKRQVEAVSFRFLLRIQEASEDRLQLFVRGRHYDSPTDVILRLGKGAWRMLKASALKKEYIYLGPAYYEIKHEIHDETWIIRQPVMRPELTRDGVETTLFDEDMQSTTILDLKVPVDESIWSTVIACERVFGLNEWQAVMPHQLERRLTLPTKESDMSLGSPRQHDGLSFASEPAPTFTPAPFPPLTSIPRTVLSSWKKRVSLVLLTVADVELHAVLLRLEPPDNESTVLKLAIGQQTYFLGKLGALEVALTRCAMGALGRDAAILSTQAALDTWKPRALLMVGIAFGKDPAKQAAGDVLVASQVISYEPQRVGAALTSQRGAIVEPGPVLLDRFKNALGWSFTRADGSTCRVHVGPLLSGEKLVDDPTFKAELFKAYPQAIGGEMEAAGVYAAAARVSTEWLVVKGVCDWADGKKHDQLQLLAADAAASLVQHVLADPYALEALPVGANRK